jgi:hypothetical protein
MSKELKAYNPVYLVQTSPETGRPATYVYLDPEGGEEGIRVPAMPKYRTTGNPKEWVKGQVWERATTYEDNAKTKPKWERIYHAQYNAVDVKFPHYEVKATIVTTMPDWSDFPVFRYNYFEEHWEVKNSPFGAWETDTRDRPAQSADHRRFVKLWFSSTYVSIAGLAKYLGWSRAKVKARRSIVQKWLDKYQKGQYILKDKIEFTEPERADFLSQHAAPTEADINAIAHLFEA